MQFLYVKSHHLHYATSPQCIIFSNFIFLQQQKDVVPIMKRPSHLQVVPDHEASHLRELLRVKDQELKGIYYKL